MEATKDRIRIKTIIKVLEVKTLKETIQNASSEARRKIQDILQSMTSKRTVKT
jgi:hypothetical protein